MIKRFKTFLKEELTLSQKHGFRLYAKTKGVDIHDNSDAINLSKHIIPEGTDSIKVPAMNSILSDVHEHIIKSGFHGMDYARGVAFKEFTDKMGKKKRQETNIGKILNTAPQDLKNRYDNDNRPETAKLLDHDVIISRNPYHVAGCSTNPDNPNIWGSCASLDKHGQPESPRFAGGHLPYDIRYGTHVAYLVPKNDQLSHDKLIDQATARILLKPFHSEDGSHTILSPESKSYSASEKVPDGFSETVRNFTDEHFPIKPDTIYNKNESLYNDDGITTLAKLNLKKPIPSSYRYDIEKLIKTQKLDPNDITDFLHNGHSVHDKYTHSDILSALPFNRGFNGSHIDHYINNNLITEIDTPRTILNHPKFTPQHFDKYFNNSLDHLGPLNQLIYATDEKKIKPHHIDKIVNKLATNPLNDFDDNFGHQNELIDNLLNTKKLTGNHIKQLVNTGDKGILHALSYHNWSKHPEGNDVLNSLTSSKQGNTLFNVLQYNTKLEPHHIDNILNSDNQSLGENTYYLTQNHPLNSNHIDKVLNYVHKNPSDQWNGKIISQTGSNKDFNINHFHRILDKMDFTGKDNAVEKILYNKDFTANETAGLLPKLSHSQKATLAVNPSLSEQHITHLLNDPEIFKDNQLLSRLISNNRLSDNHIDKLLRKNNDTLNYAISSKSKLPQKHIDHLFNQKNININFNLASGGHLNREQQLAILQDKTLHNPNEAPPALGLVAAPNLHPDTVDAIINDTSTGNTHSTIKSSIYNGLLYNNDTALQSHHLHTIATDPDTDHKTIASIAKHPKISSHTIDHIINKALNYPTYTDKSSVLLNILKRNDLDINQYRKITDNF